MIDVSKIRVGDEVTVRGKVAKIAADGDIFFESENGADGWFNRSEIVAHTPKPREFKPGDPVYANGATKWTVVHVRGLWAWLEDDNGWNRLEILKDLRHADESE